MTETALRRDEVDRLRRYAVKRVSESPHELLSDQARATLAAQPDEHALFQDLLAPEDMTLGRRSPVFDRFDERERLALNHWLYSMHYFRIATGEATVIAVNGVEGLSFPVKPLRKVLVDEGNIEKVARYFGADFVVVFFLGRGIINHMGKGFERAVGATDSESNSAVHRLSKVHTFHENHHTAVSRMLSASARDILDDPEKVGRLREVLFRLSRLIDDHFAALSGVEVAKNGFIPAPNARIVDKAAMPLAYKAEWVSWMNSDRDRLDYFPAGYQPKAR